MSEPLVTFYKVIEDGLAPRRADPSAGGTLPTRAFRFCHPATTAAGFGWYLYIPRDFTIVFDGTSFIWKYAGASDWYPLTRAQYPNFAGIFDDVAPEDCRGSSHPWVLQGEAANILQVWTGLFARTAPDWSLLIRRPANFVKNVPDFDLEEKLLFLDSRAGEVLEGIVETDRWFGPIFNNVHVKRTNVPIHFSAHIPFIQAQPIHRSAYDEASLQNFDVKVGLGALTGQDWDDYRRTVVEPMRKVPKPRGAYAVTVRKRRAEETQN